MYHEDYVKLAEDLSGPRGAEFIEKFWSRVEIVDECWIYNPPRGNKHTHPNYKRISCARVSWLLYKGLQPPNLMVCHTCDNDRCVNPDHLYLGNKSNNMQDAIDRGQWRHPKENVPKYDAIQVAIIRGLYVRGHTYIEIQNMLGIGAGTLFNIINHEGLYAD